MLMRAEACGSGDGRGEKHEYGDGGGHERSRSWEQLLRRYPDIIDPLRAYSSAVEQLPHKESVAGSILASPIKGELIVTSFCLTGPCYTLAALRQGSSVAEQGTHKPLVESSTLSPGTRFLACPLGQPALRVGIGVSRHTSSSISWHEVCVARTRKELAT